MALKDKKIPGGRKVDPALAGAIRAGLKGGRLDCAVAFKLSGERGIPPLAVGEAADSLDLHLSRCQLGLFGFPGHAKAWNGPGWKDAAPPPGFEEAVRAVLEPDGSLSCVAAWRVADRFGIARAQAGYHASRLKIKIKRCQLGAF